MRTNSSDAEYQVLIVPFSLSCVKGKLLYDPMDLCFDKPSSKVLGHKRRELVKTIELKNGFEGDVDIVGISIDDSRFTLSSYYDGGDESIRLRLVRMMR